MSTENLCSWQFDMAVTMASLAFELDDKKEDVDMFLFQTIDLVSKMHEMAQRLAGDRAGEIYAPDDEEVA